MSGLLQGIGCRGAVLGSCGRLLAALAFAAAAGGCAMNASQRLRAGADAAKAPAATPDLLPLPASPPAPPSPPLAAASLVLPAWARFVPELTPAKGSPAEVEQVASLPPPNSAIRSIAAPTEPLLADASTPVAGAPERSCVQVPDRREVQDIVAEFTGPQRSTFSESLRRSGRYLPLIRNVLVEEGLPQDLAYLALVESHFLSDARSPSGAVGIWQFMESTARNYGLRVDKWADERLDPEAATRAAVRHLGDLYARFGDWHLAVAAYNAGPGGVGRAVDRHSAESFWDLLSVGGLRAETCRYVVKFLGAVSIASDPSVFGIDIATPDPPLVYDTVWTKHAVTLATVARMASAPESDLRRLNPGLLRGLTPPDASHYPIRVPRGLGEKVARQLQALPPEQRLVLASHRVQRGETLATIARRYGTTVEAVAKVNALSGKGIRPKQALSIPVEGSGASTEVDLKLERRRSDTHRGVKAHVVSRGETLWGISRQYGVTPSDLLRWNRRGANALLRPGDKLVVAAGEG